MADPVPTPLTAERHVEKRVATIDVAEQSTETGTRLVVLRAYHATGLTVLPIMPEYAKALARELLEAAGGITVATSLPHNPTNGKQV